MPSASTIQCTQCSAPSKYTCPTCKARTCSLGCSKAHKAACSGAASTSTALPNGTNLTSVAGPSQPPAPVDFIPMTSYTDAHLLQDYHFLSSLSRRTAEAGRSIAALNLLPAPSSSTSSGSTHNASMSSGKTTPQQRQREALLKQLHYRRYKVMVLPEGMARRAANQTALGKGGKFGLSVEVKFPHHLADEAGGQSWMLHRQQPTSTIEQLILGELQHRSFPNKKELTRVKSSLATRSPKTWLISISYLSDLHLPSPKDAKQTDDGEAVIALHNWPQEWKVLVPIYSSRLTNESTTRYLDWWERKRKWEETHPGATWVGREEREQQRQHRREEEAAQQDDGWNGKRRRGEWGQKTAKDSGGDAAVVDEERQNGQIHAGAKADEATSTENTTESPVTQGIISSSLLSMLSQRLGRNVAPTASEVASSCVFNDDTTTNGPGNTTADTSIAPSNAAGDNRSSTATHPSSNGHTSSTGSDSAPPAPTQTLHILHPPHTTLAHLLTNVPDGFAVVEFPELRVVASVDGGDRLVAFAGERVATGDKGAGGERGQNQRCSEQSDERRAEGDRPSKVCAHAKVAEQASTGGSLASLLAGYASDSDDDAQEDHPNSPTAAEHQPLLQPPQAQDENKAPPSLASIASRHGFA